MKVFLVVSKNHSKLLVFQFQKKKMLKFYYVKNFKKEVIHRKYLHFPMIKEEFSATFETTIEQENHFLSV